MGREVVAALFVVMALSAAGCSSGHDFGPDSGPPSTAGALPTPTEGAIPVGKYSFPVVVQTDPSWTPKPVTDAGFVRLLDSIPDTPETRKQVWLNDFRYLWRFMEERGVSRPGKDDPNDAFGNALREVVSADPRGAVSMLPFPESAPWIAAGGFTDYGREYPFYDKSGIDSRNVDLAAKTGWGDQQQGLAEDREELEVVLGDYDRADILSRLNACIECVPYEDRSHNGLNYLAWGDDFSGKLSQRLRPPWLDDFGRGGRVATFDGKVVRALGTPGIEGLIDADLGKVATLADDPDLVIAASILDQMGVYAGVVSSADFSVTGLRDHLQSRRVERTTSGGWSYGSSGVTQTVTINGTPVSPTYAATGTSFEGVVITAPLLKPFRTAAFGRVPRGDFDSGQVVIVLVHSDEACAQANARLLLDRLQGTRLADDTALYIGSVQQVELQVGGKVLVARITATFPGFDPTSPAMLMDFPLTVHE